MKIKLGILEQDINYLKRISTALNNKYSDKIEVYMYTKKELAIQEVSEKALDILLVSEEMDITEYSLAEKCTLAYLTEKSDVQTIGEYKAVGKYQKLDSIYKDILSMYSDNSQYNSGENIESDSSTILLFATPCGGTGSSSMALATSIYLSKSGKKVLYLNLEKLGNNDLLLQGEGQHTLSDIIFALKSKKGNISLKLESCVRKDISGVHYYAAPQSALDLMELSPAEELELISYIKQNTEYDYIVIDKEFDMSNEHRNIQEMARKVLWVSDGSQVANNKIDRAFGALKTIDWDVNKISIIYNKYSNKTSQAVDTDIFEIGGAPRFEGATPKQTLEKLAVLELHKQLM